MWSERILGPEEGMVIHQIVVEWAHVESGTRTQGITANNTLTATTSHQAPSSSRLHSWSC